MEEPKVEFSPEVQEQLREQIECIVEAFNQWWESIREVVREFLEKVRQIALNLARFFLRMQLLEWCVPNKVADFISEKIYWYWAWQIGFAWFRRKFVL